MTIDPRTRSMPETKEHGPYLGARTAAPLAIALWVVLVVGMLWRI